MRMIMNSVIDLIKSTDNIVVLCHVNPDGDAIGSSIAMYNLLKKLNKTVDIVIKDVPQKFCYLNGFNDIKTTSDSKYDLAIIVDTATETRVNSSEVLDNVNKILVIDHHISNTRFGDVNYIVDAPACAEIIYNIIRDMDILIDNNIGEAIVNGILTDTGGLSHGDVKTSTYEAIYELSKTINIPYIYKRTLGTVTKSEFELKKIAINNLKFYKNNKIGYSFITEEDINSVNGTYYDASTLVNIAREIEGVYVSIFSRFFNDCIRVSLRSNNIDVNYIANKFNGGGHILASGININYSEDYEQIINNIIREVEKNIDEWDNSSK